MRRVGNKKVLKEQKNRREKKELTMTKKRRERTLKNKASRGREETNGSVGGYQQKI